jgi:hypothetical protein
MSLVEADSAVYENLVLANGTAVIIELDGITAGSIATLAQIDRENLTSSVISDLGNSDFQSYMRKLQESADIKSRILDQQPL